MPPIDGLYAPDFSRQFSVAARTFDGVVACHPLSFGVFRQAPWHHYSSLCLEQTQVTMRTPFLDNEFVKTVFRAPDATCKTNDLSMRLIADGSPVLSRIPTDRGLGGESVLPEPVAHAWQEFLFKAEYAYDYGMPQWLARLDYAFTPLHLERLFLGRHKAHHFRIWYRNQLSTYVKEMLLDARTLSRPYLDRRKVQEVVLRHTKGDRNYTTEIHKLLKIELLHRQLVDQPLARAADPEPVAVSS
jgi:asparagine synthase (glutamine-hydrolysing)